MLGAALLAALCLAPAPGAAQAGDSSSSTVRSARLSAHVGVGEDFADVRVEYELADAVPGPVRVELLGFGSADVERAQLAFPDRVVSVALEPETGSMRAGRVELSSSAAGTLPVVVTYRVAGAVEWSEGGGVRLRVPVLVVDLPPAGGGEPVFHASVTVPPEWGVAAAFPTGLARAGRGVEAAYEVELAAVPSLVSLRGSAAGPAGPGLPLVLDLAALLVLVGFTAVGWRHLSRLGADVEGSPGGPTADSGPGGAPATDGPP